MLIALMVWVLALTALPALLILLTDRPLSGVLVVLLELWPVAKISGAFVSPTGFIATLLVPAAFSTGLWMYGRELGKRGLTQSARSMVKTVSIIGIFALLLAVWVLYSIFTKGFGWL